MSVYAHCVIFTLPIMSQYRASTVTYNCRHSMIDNMPINGVEVAHYFSTNGVQMTSSWCARIDDIFITHQFQPYPFRIFRNMAYFYVRFTGKDLQWIESKECEFLECGNMIHRTSWYPEHDLFVIGTSIRFSSSFHTSLLFQVKLNSVAYSFIFGWVKVMSTGDNSAWVVGESRGSEMAQNTVMSIKPIYLDSSNCLECCGNLIEGLKKILLQLNPNLFESCSTSKIHMLYSNW